MIFVITWCISKDWMERSSSNPRFLSTFRHDPRGTKIKMVTQVDGTQRNEEKLPR